MNVRTTSKEPCSSSVGSPHETNPNVEIVLPLAEVVGLLQEGVGHLMREAGLLLLMGVMAEEVDWSGRYANNVPLTNFFVCTPRRSRITTAHSGVERYHRDAKETRWHELDDSAKRVRKKMTEGAQEALDRHICHP